MRITRRKLLKGSVVSAVALAVGLASDRECHAQETATSTMSETSMSAVNIDLNSLESQLEIAEKSFSLVSGDLKVPSQTKILYGTLGQVGFFVQDYKSRLPILRSHAQDARKAGEDLLQLCQQIYGSDTSQVSSPSKSFEGGLLGVKIQKGLVSNLDDKTLAKSYAREAIGFSRRLCGVARAAQILYDSLEFVVDGINEFKGMIETVSGSIDPKYFGPYLLQYEDLQHLGLNIQKELEFDLLDGKTDANLLNTPGVDTAPDYFEVRPGVRSKMKTLFDKISEKKPFADVLYQVNNPCVICPFQPCT